MKALLLSELRCMRERRRCQIGENRAARSAAPICSTTIVRDSDERGNASAASSAVMNCEIGMSLQGRTVSVRHGACKNT